MKLMQIFVQRDGVEQGPYSAATVRLLLSDCLLLPSDPARYENAVEWTPLATLLGTGMVPARQTSRLAVWSLVLGCLGLGGLFGMVALGISAIAAIICGHLSRREIRSSRGVMAGRGIATVGLLLGYAGLALTAAAFAEWKAVMGRARSVTAMATTITIESAVNNFCTEYNTMPSEIVLTDTSKDVSLMKTLRGEDPARNSRNIQFLPVKEAKNNKNGLDPVTSQLFDPWGRGYQVVLDTRQTEELTVTRGGITETLKGRRVAVFSLGIDGVAGTADDVRTW